MPGMQLGGFRLEAGRPAGDHHVLMGTGGWNYIYEPLPAEVEKTWAQLCGIKGAQKLGPKEVEVRTNCDHES